MILNIFIVLFVFGLAMFYLTNMFLYFRSKRHSNKVFEKFIIKNPFNLFLKPNKQGWTIVTFKTTGLVSNLNLSKLTLKRALKIRDKTCSGMADPFLFKEKGVFYLFFEYEYHKTLNKGADLAYAISKNGLEWTYKKKILKEPFHQSFPYVFKYKENHFMLPESYQSNQVRLYKADKFPNKWQLDSVLYSGLPLVDTVFIVLNSVFYWFTTNLKTNELLLFYSDGLKSEWLLHPKSPITTNVKKNRNAGAIINENNKIYRVAQDAREGYGSGINLYEIIELNKENYAEKPLNEPLLCKKKGIFKDALHHISVIDNLNEKIIAIDGANFAMNKILIK